MNAERISGFKPVLLATVALLIALLSSALLAQEEPPLIYGFRVERLEYRAGGDTNAYAWDVDGIVGSDEWKLRWQSMAEYAIEGSAFDRLENQLLLQLPISTFFDIKGGVRYDSPKGPDRLYGVLGIQGLAPLWFEIDADLFLSEKGNLSARLDVDYDFLLTNRLIFTPTAEFDVSFSDDPEIGVGTGLTKMELGVRLRYELLDRSLAPYIGIHYEQLYGSTKDFASAEGDLVEGTFFVVGVRLLF
jgi:copper resistance protein B